MFYKILLQSVSAENIIPLTDQLQKIFAIGQGQADDIVNAVPVVLLDNIPDLARANRVRERLQPLVDAGAQIAVTEEPLEGIIRLRWPEPIPILTEDEISEPATGERLIIAKYDLAASHRDTFRCPACGEVFLLKRLTTPGQIEEAAPLEERETLSELSAAKGEELDLASFEEGLTALEHGRKVADKSVPERQAAASEEDAREIENFFEELESLPTEKPTQEKRAGSVEEQLEELAPEEAAKFFEQRAREKPAEPPISPVKPGGRRITPPRHRRGYRPEARRLSPAERAAAVPQPIEPEIEYLENYYGVVISHLGTREKRESAARIIVELTDMPYPEARSLCDGVIVNALRGVSQEEAQNACQKFKEAGILAKVTVQKRKMRRSER